MKRFVPWIALIVVLLIVASVVRQCRTGGGANYQSATVMRGPITQAVTATGTLNPVVNVQVGSQVSGNIAKLFADFNSQVKAGAVVAQIDPAIFQATVTQAEGDLASAKAALELAKVTAARTQELFARKTSSQADVDQNVDFTVDAFPMQTFHGKVVQVRNAPITVQNVVTYDTVIGVSNPDLKLKPGMTANVSIIVAHRDEVLQIKNAALRYRPADATPAATRRTSSPSGARSRGERERRGGERTVYVLSGSRPRSVQIKTGISDGIVTEVLDGLKEGDRVVTAELTSTSSTATPPSNPFGGGPRRFP